jgi:hypothetical protein
VLVVWQHEEEVLMRYASEVHDLYSALLAATAASSNGVAACNNLNLLFFSNRNQDQLFGCSEEEEAQFVEAGGDCFTCCLVIMLHFLQREFHQNTSTTWSPQRPFGKPYQKKRGRTTSPSFVLIVHCTCTKPPRLLGKSR